MGDPLPREQMGSESVGMCRPVSAQQQTSWLQLQECWHRDWDQGGMGMGTGWDLRVHRDGHGMRWGRGGDWTEG